MQILRYIPIYYLDHLHTAPLLSTNPLTTTNTLLRPFSISKPQHIQRLILPHLAMFLILLHLRSRIPYHRSMSRISLTPLARRILHNRQTRQIRRQILKHSCPMPQHIIACKDTPDLRLIRRPGHHKTHMIFSMSWRMHGLDLENIHRIRSQFIHDIEPLPILYIPDLRDV